MKKDWQKPEIEVLNVNETMLGQEGDFTDNDFSAGTPFADLTFS